MTTTIYNGTVFCEKCGEAVDPVVAMYSPKYCAKCEADRRKTVLKGRMAP